MSIIKVTSRKWHSTFNFTRWWISACMIMNLKDFFCDMYWCSIARRKRKIDLLVLCLPYHVFRESLVGIETKCELDCQGSIPRRGKNSLFSPQSSGRAWIHPAFHPLGTVGFFLIYGSRSVNLATQFHIIPKSRMMNLYIHSLIRLHGALLN